jgi:hypothetical protein
VTAWTARAEEIAEDATTLGGGVARVNARAWAAGVDPGATGGLVGAALTLGASPAQLLVRPDLQPLHDDREMRETASDLESEAAGMLRAAGDLREHAIRDHDAACTAIAGQQAAQAAGGWPYPAAAGTARRVIADCECAIEIADVLIRRLEYAARCLSQVPDDLLDIYQVPYDHIRRGGVLPYRGDFLTAGIPQGSAA